MALVPNEQLTKPAFSSILLIGPPFTGKTRSLASLRDVLVHRKLPTKMAFFDLDGGTNGGGAETLLRLARAGNWLPDLELYRYTSRVADKIANKVEPNRSTTLFMDFLNEFNALHDRIDPKTGNWLAGRELGAIVIDSSTGLMALLQDFVFESRHVEIGGDGPKAVTFNHWRLLAEKYLEAISCARSLPCYLVVTAHVETKQQVIKGPAKDGSDDIATHQLFEIPLLPTNILRDGLAKQFSVVLYSCVENGEYKWRTRPSERIRSAGTRGRDGLPAMVAQSFKEVLDLG